MSNDSLEPLRSLAREAGRERAREGRRALHRAPRSRVGGPPGSEGRWSLRSSRWEKTPTSTEKATATGRALLERYGVVLREAAGAEGLVGGFGYVYDVFRAMEEQGRVRRGYFVAGRGATQFALPGAEERLRAPLVDRTDDDDDDHDQKSRAVILAATDPANPYGTLLPWPDAHGRSVQRAAGARVILLDGRLLAWLSRDAHQVATFLNPEEPLQSKDAAHLGEALAALSMREHRSMMIATIDGEPAPESPIAPLLTPYGFVKRQGALVKITEQNKGFGRRMPASLANASAHADADGGDVDDDVGITFDFSDAAVAADDA